MGSRTSKPVDSTPFPAHTAVATFGVDLAITILIFLSAMMGLEANPNLSHPPVYRRLMFTVGGGLLGWYFLVHLLTPGGLLPGLPGIIITSLLTWMIGGIPLCVSPVFRDVLHAVPQTWLIGLHMMRISSFLLLTMFDMKLLPPGYALPAGWGGVLVGTLAPFAAHAFGTKSRYAREMGIAFHLVGTMDILMELTLGFALLGPYLEHRMKRKLKTRYLWYTIWLIPRYAMPLLVLMHAYSIWKLLTEKEEPFMKWQEEDDVPGVSAYALE